MSKTAVGLFDDRDDAQRAVKALLDKKFVTDKISIITADPHGEFQMQKIDSHGNKASQGALAGAATGAVVGGIFGLLVGVGVVFLPAVGMFVAGPLATALAGAGVGALGGGIVGGLIGLSIPEEHAHTYAEAIRRGSVLVAVEVDSADADAARDIMRRHNAADVTLRQQYYAQQGFTRYDSDAPAYTAEQAAQEREAVKNYYSSTAAGSTGMAAVSGGSLTGSATSSSSTVPEQEMQRAYETQFAGRGLSFERFQEAYMFGHDLPNEPRYASDWTSNEAEISRMWEATRPNSWSIYRDAAYAGWSRARARRGGAMLY